MNRIILTLLLAIVSTHCSAATLTANKIPKVKTGGSAPQLSDSNISTNTNGDLIVANPGVISGNGSSITNLSKTQVGLSNVENTALSTWAGSSNITTIGTIATGTVPETKVSFTDVTTNNASTSKHGFAPKLSGTATTYLDGTGNFSVPAGSGGGAGSNATIVTANGFAGSTDSSNNVTLQTTVNGLVKANGTALSGATSGVDYAPATSGTGILKGNGSGGFSTATSSTDYAPATSGNGLLKGNGTGGFSTASAGTDYVSPTGTETLTNKTLTTPIISTISNTGTLTLPTSTDILIGRATTDTLTNKTYDTAGTGNSFKINGTAITSISGNTAKVATTSGTLTSGNCAKFDASGNIVDNGAACSGSAVINSGTSGQLGYYASSGTTLSGLSQIGNSYINWSSMTAANQSVNWAQATQYAGSWVAQGSGVGTLQLYDSSGVNWVKIAAPSTINGTSTWTVNQPRVNTVASSATPSINTDTTDMFTITALAVDITSMTSGLSGTPVNGQSLVIRITGTAARAITWGASFEASTDLALPTTTTTTKTLYTKFIYNSTAAKWDLMAKLDNF